MSAHRSRCWGILIGAALVGLHLVGPTRAEELVATGTLQVGVIRSLFRDTPEPMIPVLMRPFRSLLETQTGLRGQMITVADVEHLGRQLMDGKAHLGVLHGVEYAWLRQRYPQIKPLVIVVNERRNLEAFLVVPRDSRVAGFADLKGKTVALARFSREHCHLFLERGCQQCGATPQHFFAKLTTPGDAEDALDHVVRGAVAATIVDGITLDYYERQKPGCFAKLKTAVQSEPFPAAVIVYRPDNLDDVSVQRVRDGLLRAAETTGGRQLLKMCRMTGFETVPDDYGQLLDQIIKAYPPPATTTVSGK
jgi:ABC-type phosphate/phosphonate transport system substrate-binding protein